MAAIRLFRQGMIRMVMAGRIGRLNTLSSLIGNLAFCDGDTPLFSTWIEDRGLNKQCTGVGGGEFRIQYAISVLQKSPFYSYGLDCGQGSPVKTHCRIQKLSSLTLLLFLSYMSAY